MPVGKLSLNSECGTEPDCLYTCALEIAFLAKHHRSPTWLDITVDGTADFLVFTKGELSARFLIRLAVALVTSDRHVVPSVHAPNTFDGTFRTISQESHIDHPYGHRANG
ncbi:hypothetical protein TNIN_296711 [Trichonephila inaurata madagascariensis]|uniref:Uncharacterized protein n=1 Tax=Trichonephila inaurata madagascariensis TaxID=2747483 RepID=A0A8X7C768_9ARAC|nr:hypothetical protein TNIN_296711 [Trichonephila inaurata madagascariensis]